MGLEVSLIWGSSWTYTKFMFLATRYLPIPGNLLLLYSAFSPCFRGGSNDSAFHRSDCNRTVSNDMSVDVANFKLQVNVEDVLPNINDSSSGICMVSILCAEGESPIVLASVSFYLFFSRNITSQDMGCLEPQSKAWVFAFRICTPGHWNLYTRILFRLSVRQQIE